MHFLEGFLEAGSGLAGEEGLERGTHCGKASGSLLHTQVSWTLAGPQT